MEKVKSDRMIERSELSELIDLPAIPRSFEALHGTVSHADEIDEATAKLGIPPILLNLNLAAPRNLSFLNLGIESAVYVPRQITEREGGRKSLYHLCPGESSLPGVFFTSQGMLIRNVKRVSGEGNKAKTGDIYQEQLLDRDGRIIYEGQGYLEIKDEKNGVGQYVLRQTKTPQYSLGASKVRVKWWIWSFYAEIELGD